MPEHRSVEFAGIDQQGLDRISQAPVALFPVSFRKDERPQGMEQGVVALDDRPFPVPVRKGFFC